MQSISSDRFYAEYHGHRAEDLEIVEAVLRSKGEREQSRHCIYLAGDSSLDNKVSF